MDLSAAGVSFPGYLEVHCKDTHAFKYSAATFTAQLLSARLERRGYRDSTTLLLVESKRGTPVSGKEVLHSGK